MEIGNHTIDENVWQRCASYFLGVPQELSSCDSCDMRNKCQNSAELAPKAGTAPPGLACPAARVRRPRSARHTSCSARHTSWVFRRNFQAASAAPVTTIEK